MSTDKRSGLSRETKICFRCGTQATVLGTTHVTGFQSVLRTLSQHAALESLMYYLQQIFRASHAAKSLVHCIRKPNLF